MPNYKNAQWLSTAKNKIVYYILCDLQRSAAKINTKRQTFCAPVTAINRFYRPADTNTHNQTLMTLKTDLSNGSRSYIYIYIYIYISKTHVLIPI